jgi:hypothetical protein
MEVLLLQAPDFDFTWVYFARTSRLPATGPNYTASRPWLILLGSLGLRLFIDNTFTLLMRPNLSNFSVHKYNNLPARNVALWESLGYGSTYIPSHHRITQRSRNVLRDCLKTHDQDPKDFECAFF